MRGCGGSKLVVVREGGRDGEGQVGMVLDDAEEGRRGEWQRGRRG